MFRPTRPSRRRVRQILYGLASAVACNALAATAAFAQPGQLDPSFGGDGRVITSFGNIFDIVRSAVLQPDGKIVVSGWTRQSQDTDLTFSNHDFALARYNRNGSLDNTFGFAGLVTTDFGGTSDVAEGIVLQPDGKIIVAGSASPRGGRAGFAVVRYNRNGGLDATFGMAGLVITDVAAGGLLSVDAVALQPDGKIVVGGTFGSDAPAFPINTLDFALVRYNGDGTLDEGFGFGGVVITDVLGVNGPDSLGALIVRPDGKILALGSAGTFDPATGGFGEGGGRVLVRYNPNGMLDGEYGSGGVMDTGEFPPQPPLFIPRGDVADAVLDADGNIIVAGTGISRYDSEGTPVRSFVNPFNMVHSGVALQTSGKIVAVGAAEPIGSDTGRDDFGLIRLNADLTLDLTFGAGGFVTTDLTGPDERDEARAVVLQPDGKIVVAGNAGGSFGLARYLGDRITASCPYKPYAYVTNNQSLTVSVIDTLTETIVATVPVGFGPSGVAISPDGCRVYVTHGGGADFVSIIDTATHVVTTTVTVGSQPLAVAVTPDGASVYVANSSSDSVSVIDAGSDTVVVTIPVGHFPTAVAVSPFGGRVYVASLGGDVSVISTATNTVIATISLGGGALDVAVAPVGDRLYVANGGGGVAVIDALTNEVVARLLTRADDVAVTPGGARVYVSMFPSSVAVLDAATNAVVTTITDLVSPTDIAITPDGHRAYVTQSGGANSVAVIDTVANAVTATILAGTLPAAVAIVPLPPIVTLLSLASHVQQLNLNFGETNSLVAILGVVERSLARGNAVAALNQIDAFMNRVRALERNGQLDSATAALLVTEAETIKSAI